jgi:hypothetical protein
VKEVFEDAAYQILTALCKSRRPSHRRTRYCSLGEELITLICLIASIVTSIQVLVC